MDTILLYIHKSDWISIGFENWSLKIASRGPAWRMAMAKKKNNGIPSGYVRTVTENDHDIVSPPIKIFFVS